MTSIKYVLAGRPILIATQHQKEKVIGSAFSEAFGTISHTPKRFNTDSLGTFTGEIERKDDPLTTARKKCLLAMEMEVFDLCIASEGSFGPHPGVFFVNANEEWIVCIDKKNGYEFSERLISTETNFHASTVNNWNELVVFAEQVHFPEHGLILRKEKNALLGLKKGIRNWDELKTTYNELSRETPSAYVETDMRAHQNPTRMKNIERLTQQLIQKIKSLCPSCNQPGFGEKRAVAGLPCSLCGFPTKSTLSLITACTHCHFETEDKFPAGKQQEDPMYCDICNP